MFAVRTDSVEKKASKADFPSAMDALITYFRGGKHVTMIKIKSFLRVAMPHYKVRRSPFLWQVWVVDWADTSPMKPRNIR